MIRYCFKHHEQLQSNPNETLQEKENRKNKKHIKVKVDGTESQPIESYNFCNGN